MLLENIGEEIQNTRVSFGIVIFKDGLGTQRLAWGRYDCMKNFMAVLYV